MTIRDARGRFTTTTTGTVDDIGHRPGTVVLDGDGVRHRTVRFAMFAPHTVTLVYTSGPSDVFRRGIVLTVVGAFAPYGHASQVRDYLTGERTELPDGTVSKPSCPTCGRYGAHTHGARHNFAAPFPAV